MTDSALPSPIFKWAGGKRSLLPQIRPLLPQINQDAYDMMMGGGSMAIELVARSNGRVYLNDINSRLIRSYQAIACEPETVGKLLSQMAATYLKLSDEARKVFYYAVRKEFNKPIHKERSLLAAQALFLNRTCFNGLWRENANGALNVSHGKYKVPSFPTQLDLGNFSRFFFHSRIRFSDQDFSIEARHAKPGDFVYFDPPYVPETASGFTTYSRGGFGPEDQQRLVNLARWLADRGVLVAVSNSDTPTVHRLFDGWHIHKLVGSRSISRNGGDRGPKAELLITSYDV